MTVHEEYLEENDLILRGFMHEVQFSAVEKDHLDRDTMVALLLIKPGGSAPEASALFDWEDIEALHRWTGQMIKERAEHEADELSRRAW